VRSARLEMPRTTIKTIDVQVDASDDEVARVVSEELRADGPDVEIMHQAGNRSVPRLAEAPAAASALQRGDSMQDAKKLPEGLHIVTGGLGGLGLVAAQQLAELGAPKILLTSRSGRVPEGQGLETRLKWLQELPSGEVHIRKCDVASANEVSTLIPEASTSISPIRGIIHAAGVLDRCPLAELDAERLKRVVAPKASGAWHLHTATSDCDLGLFVMFSSVSSMLGLAGGSSYSAANAYLDGLAQWRWERKGGQSILWGPVAEVGMTAAAGSDGHLEGMSLKTISPAQVASALRVLLVQNGPRAQPSSQIMLARADWAGFVRELGFEIPQIRDFEAKQAAGAKGSQKNDSLAGLPAQERESAILQSIRGAASGMSLEIDDETPLMEAGIDSLSAVEFRNKIASEFREVRLPSTLMFDYPTPLALAQYVSSQIVHSDSAVSVQPQPSIMGSRPSSSQQIAVLGVACHLPGDSMSLKAFATTLSLGTDCIVEVPYNRWDATEYYDPEASTGLKMYVKHAGFIEGAELFAASTFNIGRPEAETMDPQQRHLLETAFESFTCSGFSRGDLMGSLTGVFVGQDKCDWNRMLTGAQGGPYAATGGSSSISANRISYVLGLKGPSATVDTACSSSLVAADTAAATLRRMRCNLASVCGVNMLLLPQTFVACCQAHMLSEGGRCRTFDDSASGYARGEGSGAHTLERLRDAPAFAELRGSALNQDGRSSNLTSPNGPSQTAVVLAALSEAQVVPSALDCLETHGTGTELGDPIEVGALQAALGGASRERPLLLGAVKTNIGHLEGGAGIAGMTKLVAMLEQRCIPANLHLKELNEHVHEDLESFAVRLPTEKIAIGGREAMTASVSSFGFGGTNGHVLLQSPLERPSDLKTKKVVFLFTGQGSQYVDMGKQLYEKEPVFRTAIDQCAKALRDVPLLDILYNSTGKGADGRALIDQTQYSQPAIFAIQYALSELWRSHGIQPCAVLGHSVGEYCAAVVAGVLSLNDALHLIAARGRLIAECCESGVGSMVALFATVPEVSKVLSGIDSSEVSIAAVNGSKMVVVSGRSNDVDKVVAEVGCTSRQLNVSHAFHSPLMAPALEPFSKELESVSLQKPVVPFFSTLLGRSASEELTERTYWADHIKKTVEFESALKAVESSVQPDVYLEIGATPILLGMGKRILSRNCNWLPSMDPKGSDEVGVIKSAQASLASGAHQVTASLNRQPFPWREMSHPLIRNVSTRPDGAKVYGSKIGGHVLELLSHHIVHGEVVVPGACYLEMILAGCTDHVGKGQAWCVENLGFAKPLVLRLLDGQLEETTEMRLVIHTDGRLEVESEIGSDPDDSILSTHVEASLVLQPDGWQDARNKQEDNFDLVTLKDKCKEQVDIDLMYSFGQKSGLPLQRRFRTVRHVQKGDRESIGRLEMERDGTQVGFWLGPSVIDGSFQASMALADADVGIGTLKIPLSIRRLQPLGRSYSIAVWSYFQLIDFTDHSTVFRSWLLNDAGEALLYFDRVHLQEVRDEHIQKVLAASGRQGSEQQALYNVQWKDLSIPEQAAASLDDTWLFLGQEDQIVKLGSEQHRCIAHQRDANLLDKVVVMGLLQERKWAGIAFVHGISDTDDVDVLNFALILMQVAAEKPNEAPPIWFVTLGAQPLASESVDSQASGSPTHAGLWGFTRAILMEYPGMLQVGSLDLDAMKTTGLPSALSAALPVLQSSGESELALREDSVRISRLVRSSVQYTGSIRLNMAARGALTNLRPVPQNERRDVVPGFVQLRIRAVGLNFRDVLNVMGLYPGDPGPPGADCAGTVIQLGDLVDTLKVGEDVFGECPGCLSTYNTGPAALLAKKPKSWSYEAACAMPVIFVTVEESLGDLACLKKGERVLIHAAAGGVGLVAIQYAQHVGAEVYATAGAEEKHEFLRSLGVKYITSSRNGAKFEEDMTRMLKDAGADGLDVVLNSLSHDDYIPRSLKLLRKGGRFMEIGKRGIWSHDAMREARPDVMYEKIAADTMMEKEPWKYNSYLSRLLDRVEKGGLSPINLHIFDGLEKGVAALQFLQRANNIGKVVVCQPSKMFCKPDTTAVLSGGMGALGVVTAQFLVEEGAKSVCLLSRSGKPSSDVEAAWGWLTSSVAEVLAPKCNVSNLSEVLALQKVLNSPLSCLLHLAGVLADGMLPALTHQHLKSSYGPKVHGLHNLCKLQFEKDARFVLFSSTSALFGSPGQANYSASNAVLDSLAPHWSARKERHAWSVQWGPWAEVGMAVQKNTLQRAKAMGVGALSTAHGMGIMASILVGPEVVVGAAPVRWNKYLRSAYLEVPHFLEDMHAEAKQSAHAATTEGSGAANSALAGLSPEERLDTIRNNLREIARNIVDSADLAVDSPLLESGMDSLSGVEFRNRLQSEFEGVRLPNSLVFDYPNVVSLAGFLSDQFSTAAPVSDAPSEPKSSANDIAAEATLVEKLNDRSSGSPIFLVPGAGMQAGGFRALAAMLPIPAYGLSWPKGVRAREHWPSSLKEFAEEFFRAIRQVQPKGPYAFAGHSFGATVCLEMARVVESLGEKVALVTLLDPRSLPPFAVDIAAAFAQTGLADSLALLSQSASDGSRYAEQLEELSHIEEGKRDEAVRKMLPTAFLSSLEHIHETTKWYSALLAGYTPDAEGSVSLQGRTAVLRAAQTWREGAVDTGTKAEAMVRQFQAATFEDDGAVADRVAPWCSGGVVTSLRIPGTHFTMLHEPHVVTVALRLCRLLDEVGIMDASDE